MDKTFKFSVKRLNALPTAAPKRRDTYFDTDVPSLSIRVTDSGKKSFVVRKRIAGKPVRVTLGSYPMMSIDIARVEAQRVGGRMAVGTNPNEEKQARIESGKRQKLEEMTVAHVLAEYSELGDIRPSTAKGYKSALQTVLGDAFAKPLIHITARQVLRFHQYPSKSRANHAMRALSALHNWHCKLNKLNLPNPVTTALSKSESGTGKSLWHTAKRRKTWIEDHLVPAWFDAAEKLVTLGSNTRWEGTAVRDLFKFQLFTGLRSQDECANLVWDRVDIKGQFITLLQTKTSSEDDEPITIPMNSYAMDILNSRPRNDQYVFPHNGTWLKDARTYVRAIRKEIGWDWTPYDSRRTFLAHGEKVRAPIVTLKRLVHHKTQETDPTIGYLPPDDDLMRTYSQRIGDSIIKAANRQSGEVIELPLSRGTKK